MPLKVSATSVFLPHLDLEQTCAVLQQHGYDGIELRVRHYSGDPNAAPGNWGRHVTDISPDNVLARAGEIKATLAAHHLTLAAFASNVSALELDTVKLLAEGAAATGCPLIRIGAPRGYDGKTNYFDLYDEAVRAFEKVIPITRAHGVRCLIEIHGGGIFVSASFAYRLLSRFDPADIGVIYDPQNMVSDGFETTPMALDLLGNYLAHLHVGGHLCVPGTTDEKGTVIWEYPGCRLQEGRYNHARLIAELHKRGYTGFISVEDFDPKRTPEQRLADAIDYLHRIDPGRMEA
jgi:sugar phosphate isomerase/epimerase